MNIYVNILIGAPSINTINTINNKQGLKRGVAVFLVRPVGTYEIHYLAGETFGFVHQYEYSRTV